MRAFALLAALPALVAANCYYHCYTHDESGTSVKAHYTYENTLHCNYDGYCVYNATTGEQVQDHNNGNCSPAAIYYCDPEVKRSRIMAA